MLKNMKIGTRMVLGLGLVLAFVVILGVLSWVQSDLQWKKTKTMYDHPLKVRNAIDELNLNIEILSRSIRDLILADSKKDTTEFLKMIETAKLNAKNDLDILSDVYLGPRDDITNLQTEFDKWTILRDETIRLINTGKKDEAKARIKKTGIQHIQGVLVKDHMETIDKFAIKKGDQLTEEAKSLKDQTTRDLCIVIAAILILSSTLAFFLLKSIRNPLNELNQVVEQFSQGNLDSRCNYNSENEIGMLSRAFNKMAEALKTNRDLAEKDDWLKTGIARINQSVVGDQNITELASNVITELCSYLDAHIGAIYMVETSDKSKLSLLGTYAYNKRKNLSSSFRTGEGLIGQAALEKQQIVIKNVPEDYIQITSALGESAPQFICVTPIIRQDDVKGVVEIGMLSEMTDLQMQYLKESMDAIAIALESSQSRTKLADALEESQAMGEELQAQQEELKTANEELEEQTKNLKQSEEKLKAQQEELQVTNEELEEKNELLDRQKKEVEKARENVEKQAEKLAVASKYKSEFLANMSHELRTPLNSLLLLANSLSENKGGNMTPEQVEAATIIHNSGSDLLSLINEILDLSKIEAGRMDLDIGDIDVKDIAGNMRRSFQHMAEEKGIKFEIKFGKKAPLDIISDRKRIEQIVKNLISNAIKFTEKGKVLVSFDTPSSKTNFLRRDIKASECLAIEVKDTGIGISQKDQNVIFEAFQQVDGGTARKFGGTGLGLSISRELSRLLGGEIHVESSKGKGSVFTLFIPTSITAAKQESIKAQPDSKPAPIVSSEKNKVQKPSSLPHIDDDRKNIQKGEKCILVIEDDVEFAKILYKMCKEKGFKCIAAPTGESGLELAEKHSLSAVILDLTLPGMDGWNVLDVLKENINTRHVPVHIISAEEPSSESVSRGAIGHAVKPVNKQDLEDTFRKIEQITTGKTKRVLVVDDDKITRNATVKLLGNTNIDVTEVENAKSAIEELKKGEFDCIVLDLGLPDMDGMEMLKKLKKENISLPPIIVYTSRDLTPGEEMELREHAETIVIKDVRSQDRLLDEVTLFLHMMVDNMPEKQRRIISSLHDTDEFMRDKKVLIVDDDMRTTFAMSHLLSGHGMKPLKAENGIRALKVLDENPDVDVVLMDIMMPVMDGYETMKRIRKQDKYRNLPIIVLTAKAMPEDRKKCLEVGASDYLPKPVDQKKLLSMLRVWLCR